MPRERMTMMTNEETVTLVNCGADTEENNSDIMDEGDQQKQDNNDSRMSSSSLSGGEDDGDDANKDDESNDDETPTKQKATEVKRTTTITIIEMPTIITRKCMVQRIPLCIKSEKVYSSRKPHEISWIQK